jgi:hypothetical protein
MNKGKIITKEWGIIGMKLLIKIGMKINLTKF